MSWSDWPTWLQNLVLTGGVLVVGLIAWLIFSRLVNRWVGRKVATLTDGDDLSQKARAQRLETLGGTIKTVIALGILAGVVIYVLTVWGIPLGPLVAGLGFVGVALGFGAQDFVRDVIAGFFVLVEDQYALGDVVEIAGVTGTVEEMRLRTTVLRSLDGSLHHVPNGEVRVATNMTPDFSRMVIDVGITYDSDIDAAIAAIDDEAARFRSDDDWERFHAGEPEMLGVNELADSSVVIRTVFTTDPEQRWAIKREFLRRVKYRLDLEGIEIAYPHLQIVQRTD